jgi:hypothetical protein
MTSTTGKKAEGHIEDLNPTSILVDNKTVYIPADKRPLIFEVLKLARMDKVRIFYNLKGNLTGAELIKKGEPEPEPAPENTEHIKAEANQEKDLHIQSPTQELPKEISNGGKKTEMHIQKDTYNPVAQRWVPENEREFRITLQSVLARSVEIVNAHYQSYPDILNGKDFVESLFARCDNIESVTDELLKYVKKKIEDEQIQR